MLVERVHVADAPEVLNAYVASNRLLILIETNVPIALLICSPTWLLIKLLHVLQNYLKVIDAVC